MRTHTHTHTHTHFCRGAAPGLTRRGDSLQRPPWRPRGTAHSKPAPQTDAQVLPHVVLPALHPTGDCLCDLSEAVLTAAVSFKDK